MKPNIKDGESRRKKEQDQRFLFSNNQTPCLPRSLISQINSDFNGILENYYGSTCQGFYFVTKQQSKKKIPIFSNIADRFAATSIL